MSLIFFRLLSIFRSTFPFYQVSIYMFKEHVTIETLEGVKYVQS